MKFRRVKLGPVQVVVAVDETKAASLLKGLSPTPPAAVNAAVDSTSGIADSDATAAGDKRRRIQGHTWYHSIDLGDGVVTPGWYDHRPYVDSYPIPADLTGKRVLEVATYDGFWAFEFKKRGAATVVALDVERYADIDLSPAVRAACTPQTLANRMGAGFEIARDILKLDVERRVRSVYDLSPHTDGTFDLVFCSDLLIHLSNPVKALQNIAAVTGDYALLVEPFTPGLPESLLQYRGGAQECTWWSFGLGTLEQMIRDAGFARVERIATFKVGVRGQNPTMWRAVFRAQRTA